MRVANAPSPVSSKKWEVSIFRVFMFDTGSISFIQKNVMVGAVVIFVSEVTASLIILRLITFPPFYFSIQHMSIMVARNRVRRV